MSIKVVADELARLEKKHSDSFTPELVEREARKQSSPLHDCFEWDDKKAGHQFRIGQARRLIRSVTIITRTETRVIETPVYTRNPEADSNQQGYTSIPRLMSDEEAARHAIVEAFKRAASALSAAQDLAEVLNMSDQVGNVIAEINDLKRKAAPLTEAA